MRYGVVLLPGSPSGGQVDLWQACDRGGLDVIGLADSPAVAREVYVTAAQAVAATSRATVMTAVTNPVSRDLSVTAAALATLHEMAPGRIAFGIGTGDSALWGVGLRSARVESMREYIVALKVYLRGERVHFRGREFASSWLNWDTSVEIPILVACSGTKVLRMAAQTADGLILAMGFGAHNLEYVHSTIEEACAEVGRDPAELEIWGHGALTFGSTVEAAMQENLGVNPGWLTMGTLEGKQIPPEHREALVKLTASFRDLDAEYASDTRGARLVMLAKQLGVYEWLIARAPRLWGPPDVIASRLAELADAGVPNWIFYLAAPDSDRAGWVEKFTSRVLPRVRELAAMQEREAG